MSGTSIKSAQPGADKKRLTLSQKLIYRAFLPMRLGSLTILLPDGKKIKYGNGFDSSSPKRETVEAIIRVINNNFFRKCVLFGDVGFGESYVDGDWETDDIVKVVEWMILNVENHPTMVADKPQPSATNFLKVLNNIYNKFRINTLNGSRKNISAHYDLSNEFFKLFLDPTMTYSSADFINPTQNLQEAQQYKYDRLCQKIQLKRDDHVLEIGCGWGGFAIHAAKNYGCRVTAVTISQKQFEFVQEQIRQQGLERQIELKLIDYRLLSDRFDKIVSVEMIEAVGHEFLEDYFGQCQRLLRKDGFLAIQVILSPDHRYDHFRKNIDWIQKYIFPGSLLPSLAAIHGAINKTGTLNFFDYEDITSSYVKTLGLWRRNFNVHLNEVRRLGFDDAFIRKWNYYLSYCEAAFKMRNISVAQVVFTRPNNLNL